MLDQVNLTPGLKYTLRSMPRGKDRTDKIEYSCNVPHRTISIDADGNCFLCGCEGWLPIPVGKVDEFNSIDEILNSPIAKKLQDDVDQKKYTWCAIEHCGVLHNNIDCNSHQLNLNLDNSCNLACPSCRREQYMLTSGSEYDNKQQQMNQILSWLEKFNNPIDIRIGGSGDALAAPLNRHFIKNYVYRSNQRFHIGTNGLLLKKVMTETSIRPAVKSFSISIDAGSQEVYENVRRPGKWHNLLENLEWLSQNKLSSVVRCNFVMQKSNYKDLPNFVDLCNRYNFLGVVQPLNDWGTWNSTNVLTPDSWTVINGSYLDHDVANPVHPEHQGFLEVLRDVRRKNFKFLNFYSFFNKFQ